MKDSVQQRKPTQVQEANKNPVSQRRPKFVLQDNRKPPAQCKSNTNTLHSLAHKDSSALPVNNLPLSKGIVQNKVDGRRANISDNKSTTIKPVTNQQTTIQCFPGGGLALSAIGAIGGAAATLAGPALSGALGLAGTAATVATGGLALAGAGAAMGTAYLAHAGFKKAQAWNAARNDMNTVRAGGRPGLADKVGQIGNLNERAWMADIMTGDIQHPEGGIGGMAAPGVLGFNPRMKFQLSPVDYATWAVGPRMADPNMHFNPATHEVHSAYPPQQLKEIDSEFYNSQLDIDEVDNLHPHATVMDRVAGNPQALDREQQDRVDLLHASHERINNFDPTAFDTRFSPANKAASTAALALAPDGPTATHRLLHTEDHPGFALGEDHGTPLTRKFLADNMADLVNNQHVSTIYMEHIRHEYQPIVDAWLAAAPGAAMPRALDNYVTRFDQAKSTSLPAGNLRRVLTEAKLHHARVRSIDALASKQTMRGGRPDDMTLRDATMNVFGEQQINADAPARLGGKYVILAGMAHNNTQPSANSSPHGGLNKGVPGFSQLLNIPAVTVNAGETLDLDPEVTANR